MSSQASLLAADALQVLDLLRNLQCGRQRQWQQCERQRQARQWWQGISISSSENGFEE
jgi:hypothetical protein